VKLLFAFFNHWLYKWIEIRIVCFDRHFYHIAASFFETFPFFFGLWINLTSFGWLEFCADELTGFGNSLLNKATDQCEGII
jgi:hypothetical protein